MLSFPIEQFLVESDISPLQQRADEIAQALTTWTPRNTQKGTSSPASVAIEANGFEQALERMNHLFVRNAWSDGLPLYAPTQARVDWILTGSDRDREERIGKIMPKGGIATIETLAISLAMAGGRPEYLPILIAAVDAFLDPSLEHDKLQATSGSTFPVVIVNGPIASRVRLNAGFGLLGPDPQHPAGASIGRALRLLQQNVGGALPGVGTMSIYGGMRYTNAVFAEDEAGLPRGWPAVATEQAGVPIGANAVTVYVSTGASNIVRRGVGKEAAMEEAEQGLQRVASYLKSNCVHYAHGWNKGTPGALLIPRPVAMQLAALGWDSKQKVREYLFERSKISAREIRESGMRQWIEAAGDLETQRSVELDPWPITRRPEQILIAVAGGAHPTHNFWMQAMSPAVVTRAIDLPMRFEQLIAEAELELGPSGQSCVV